MLSSNISYYNSPQHEVEERNHAPERIHKETLGCRALLVDSKIEEQIREQISFKHAF